MGRLDLTMRNAELCAMRLWSFANPAQMEARKEARKNKSWFS